MPFLEPVSKLIQRFHFRQNAYEFLIESVLESSPQGVNLQIDTSAGYLVTTLAALEPRPRQTISYVSQPDGSWLARDRITLLVSGSSLINGTVTLRDPLGETLVLKVNISTSLYVGSSQINFTAIQPGRQAYAMLNISQQGADTPVVLSTDDHRFSLATKMKEFNFVSSLTLTPSFDGTTIYLRFAPNRAGWYRTNLLITTPYETKTVTLEGRAGGLWVMPRRTNLLPQGGASNRHRVTAPTQWWEISSLVLLGGLAYASFMYRCQLIPSLCQTQGVELSNTAARDTAFANEKAAVSAKEEFKTHWVKPAPTATNPNRYSVARKPKPIAKPAQHQTVAASQDNGLKIDQPTPVQVTKRFAPSLPKPVNTDQESDLEKELNAKPIHKN